MSDRLPAEVLTLGECLASFVAMGPGPLAEATTFERHVAMGNACGALAVAAAGDQAGLPDRSELGRLHAGGGTDTLR